MEVRSALVAATETGKSVEDGGAAVPSEGPWGALGPLVRAFCFLLFLDGPACSDEA